MDPAVLWFIAVGLCVAVWMAVRVELDYRAEDRWNREYMARLEANGRVLRARIRELNRGHPARRPLGATPHVRPEHP